MIPEMPLELFAEPDDAPAGDLSEEDAAIERSEWLSDAIDIFHGERLEEIERVALEHFGRLSLFSLLPPSAIGWTALGASNDHAGTTRGRCDRSSRRGSPRRVAELNLGT